MTSLSIDKLENVLAKKGFLPLNYFISDNRCHFIEVISINTVQKFVLSIPKSYNFFIKHKLRDAYYIHTIPLSDGVPKLKFGDSIDKLVEKEIEKEIATPDLGSISPHKHEGHKHKHHSHSHKHEGHKHEGHKHEGHKHKHHSPPSPLISSPVSKSPSPVSKSPSLVSKSPSPVSVESVESTESTESPASKSPPIAEKYGRSPNIEDTYENIEIPNENINLTDKEMEKKLIENYKRPIVIKEINPSDANELRDIFRHLRRLKYCVENIRYKLVVIYKNYLCVLNTNDTIECFSVKDFSKIDCRRLLVSIDLELFFNKFEDIEEDVDNVLSGIRKVLEKNSNTLADDLLNLFEKKDEVVDNLANILEKKEKYDELIKKFKETLESAVNKEKNARKKLKNLDQREIGIYADTERVHQKAKCEENLKEITSMKDELTEKMLELTDKSGNMELLVDKILFDNIVMMNAIRHNLETLGKLANQDTKDTGEKDNEKVEVE